MRDPELIQEVTDTGEDSILIKIENLAPMDLQCYNLVDDLEFKKYITDIKRRVRGSFEYQTLIQYLRDNMDMNKCSFYENITNRDSFKIRIELHHHPFTIEDIVRTVVNKRLSFGEDTSVKMVAKEVTYLHYRLLVGLIPLSETPHEALHNGYLFIPMTKVFGNVEWFYELYNRFMDDDLKGIYEKNKRYSIENPDYENINKHILQRHYIYLDTSESYNKTDIEDTIDLMSDRINYIREHPFESYEKALELSNNNNNLEKFMFRSSEINNIE